MDKEKSVVPFEKGKGLVPKDMDGMYRLATAMAASGLMPKGIERPEAVFVALQMGFELGLTPMQAVQNIAVINGRPCMWGDAMLALVHNSKLLVKHDERSEGEGDNFSATCIVKRAGMNDVVARTFSMKKAAQAGLLSKDSWKRYPERMCQMRARSWALRDAFPDVLKGIRGVADVDDDIIDAMPGGAQDKVVVETIDKPAELKKAYDVEAKPIETLEDVEKITIKKAEPDELPDTHPYHPSNWQAKRQGDGKKTGLAGWVFKHEDEWNEVSADIQDMVIAKWRKFYHDPFPYQTADVPTPEEPDPTASEPSASPGLSVNEERLIDEINSYHPGQIINACNKLGIENIAEADIKQLGAVLDILMSE